MTTTVIRTVSLVAAMLIASPPRPGAAQDPVAKPTTTTTRSPTRLPRPSTVVGRQLEDGRIEVSWARVVGAARYEILRSVANIGMTVIKPATTDSVYVDSDVKAGNYYYYVVQAFDSANYPGLKSGSNAVQAKISATTTTQTSRPTTTGDETTATGGEPASPWSVIKSVGVGPASWSDPRNAMASVGWDFTQGGVYFIVERAAAPKGAWQTVTTTRTVPCCSYIAAMNVSGFTEGAKIIYRVTAVDSANPTRKSIPVTSNEYTVSYAQLPAPRITATQQADGTIRVTWSPVAGAARYIVKVTTQSSTRVAMAASHETTFVDPDIVAGFRYTYIVNALSESFVHGLQATATVDARQAAPTPLIVSTGTTQSATVAVNSSRSLLTPTYYRLSGVRWISLDEALATVDASGTVTGRSPGSARVLATGVDATGLVVVVPFRVSVTAAPATTSPPD